MRTLLALFFILVAASPLYAAQRNYTVTDFTRVRVEGPYAVTLTTGGAPYARAVGSQRALDRVSLKVEGRTLVIRVDRSAWGGSGDEQAGPVAINVGTHDLEQALLVGPGSLAIDRVRGLTFALSSFGAGATSVGDVTVDRLRLSLEGSGSLRVSGTAKQLDVSLNGPGLVDVAGLTAKDAVLSAMGPASLRARVTNAARINATGTATITLDGGAACTSKVSGSAVVTGC